MSEPEEKAWKLPKKFHLSEQYRDDEKQLEIIAAADAQQAEWRAKFAQPGASSLDKARGRATVIISEYEATGLELRQLKTVQREELGEAYATVGLFYEAYKATTNPALRKEYVEFWNAIQRADEEDCGHGTDAKFVKKDVYSIFHEAFVSVVKCAKCGHLNAVLTPEFILTAREHRSGVREQFTGLKPLEAREAMLAAGITPKNR